MKEVKWSRGSSEEPSRGPHRDYETNLLAAERFYQAVQKSLHPGMSVGVKDSHGLTKSLLLVAFNPPSDAKFGNYATPIPLHQSNGEYSKQVEGVFNVYMDTAKKFWDRQPKMKQSELLNGIKV